MQKVMEAAAECPECAAVVPIEADARSGEIIECPDCRSELEMASVEPPALVLAPEVEEDWGE
ncbi:lysine biosynthesis protein LysW [Nonomuraea cypriaca]|nr:lysine biosynthesis protein LysW [Nonomuraea cypriaca]